MDSVQIVILLLIAAAAVLTYFGNKYLNENIEDFKPLQDPYLDVKPTNYVIELPARPECNFPARDPKTGRFVSQKNSASR